VITGAAPSMAWSQDGQSLFYIKKHPQTLLEHEVYRHQLGTDQSQDQLVYRETDPTFSLWLEESRSKAFIFIRASSTESTEILIIPRKTPLAAPYPLLARTDQHEYRARHLKDHFYLLTNDEAPNYRLMRVEAKHAGDQSAWEPVITPDPGTFIEDFEVFDTFIVTKEIEAGIARLRIYDQSGQPTRDIPIQDIPATLNLSANPDATSTVIRYELSSLKTPDSTLAFNTETGDTQLLKQAQVDGSFNPDHYTTEYHTFSASDGAEVPISLVYNHTLKRQRRPAYLYAYGSYGYSTEPYFRSSSLSLLDRGFVFAIIHVRGGQELGRQWYEQGRLQQKKNTFTDFIEGSRYLAATGLADPNNLFAAGGSAGGLLMGVIANEAPEVYQGIIAKVPFVDVVTTMLDDSIPLTTSEYREWGDPRIAADYDYMLSYSPYDQVKAQGYPNMLVTTGLHDSQVQYFEPAKWVARLRRLKTDDNHLILDTDMASGHSGPSGRYERYRKTALEYAFILDHLKTAP
jgi:oligopeptidase B